MSFSEEEKQVLLAVKGVGPTVVKRLEQIGICSLTKLASYEAEQITHMVASMLHSSCWKNSPKAKEALQAAILMAKSAQKS